MSFVELHRDNYINKANDRLCLILWAQWRVCVVSNTREAEAGGQLEPRNLPRYYSLLKNLKQKEKTY
jgi:hypothetical protein